jgi:hypothetical protein
MVCYDGPWIQWLFCDLYTLLELGSRLRFCLNGGPGHQCCITGPSWQCKPCREGVNILGKPSVSIGPDARSSVKEIADSTSTVQTSASHGPDARIADMEIACWSSAVRTFIPLGPDAQKPYMEVTCSGRATVRTMCHTVRTRLLNRKDFPAKFSENLVSQLSVRTAHVHRTDGAQVYFAWR